MTVDQQLTLLRLAARVDPHLRQAVADVEAELERLRAVAEAAQRLRDFYPRGDLLQYLADGDREAVEAYDTHRGLYE